MSLSTSITTRENNRFVTSIFKDFDDIFSSFSSFFPSKFESSKDAYIWFDEETKEYNIKILVPGVKKEEINVEVDAQGISISSKIEKKDERGNWGVSSFNHYAGIEGIDLKSVDASLNEGVLTIKFKISEKEKTTKRITIK